MHTAHPVPSLTPSLPSSQQRFAALPLVRAGAVTAVASVTATLLIRAIALQVVDVPAAFTPLKLASVMSLTIVGVLAATLACFVLNRFTNNPIVVFRRVAPLALVLSFIPDVAIWLGHGYQHTANGSTVTPLVAMHIAVGALCYIILPQASARNSR